MDRAAASPSPRESPTASSQGGYTSDNTKAKSEGSKSLKPLSWLKSTAASLEGHVSEIRAGAALAAQELADNVQKGIAASKVQFSEHRFDVVFIEKPLGLKIDFSKAAVVFELVPGGQGERLQVQVGDRVVAINGSDLDPCDLSNPAEFIQDTQARMRVMGRPCTLSFLRMVEIPAAEESGGTEFIEGLKKLQKKIPGGFSNEKEVASAELLAQVEAATELARRCELEAEEAREEARQQAGDALAAVEEAAQLRADLAELQLTKVWKVEEIQRSAADVEAAKAEAAEIRERLEETEREMERLREERVLADERLASRQRSAGEEAAEAQRLRQQLREVEAGAEREVQLRRSAEELRQSAERRLEDAFREIGDAEARDAERRLSEASALAALREAREAAERRQGQLVDELGAAEAQLADEGRRAAELAAELQAAQVEVPRLAAAERLVPELRREVERLRKELRLFESAQAGGGPQGAVADAEGRILELSREVEQLRAAAQRHEEGAGSGGLQDSDWEKVPRVIAATPPPQPAEAAEAADEGGAEGGDKPRRERALEVKVAELEALNAQLSRQLNARPIVFQFAPNPGDDPDDDTAEDDEQSAFMQDAERPALPAAPPRPPSGLAAAPGAALGGGQPHAFAEPRVGASALALGAVVWLRRRGWKTFVACRKLRFAKSFEGYVRGFTRRMLQSPVLLWLFYVHVLVLWFLEAWRQAVSQPVGADPVDRINEQMVLSQPGASHG